MNVTIEDISKCRKRVKVEVPADRVNAEFDLATSEFLKFAQLPGFRPGKAPKPMVLKRFGKEIDEETQRKVLPKALKEVTEQKKLDVVSSPIFEDVKYHRGLSLSFTSIVDIAPEFEISNYKEISVPKIDETVTADDVKSAQDSLLSMRASFETVTDRELTDNDFAIIDYSGTLDGVSLKEVVPSEGMISGGEKFYVRMVEKEFLPGFVARIKGMKTGEQRQINVNFPEDFMVKELAGKQAVYSVTLAEIKVQVIPPMTDELAKEFGKESAADFSKFIEETLKDSKVRKGKEAQTSKIVDALLGSVSFELPESWIQDETREIIYEIVHENERRGIAPSVMEEKKNEIFENASKAAKDRVKLQFIVQKIASLEKIDVKPEEIVKEISAIAKSSNESFEAVSKRLGNTQGYFVLSRQIRTRKVLDFLLENAKVE